MDFPNKHTIIRYLNGKVETINNYKDGGKFDFTNFVLVETRMNGIRVYQERPKS